MVSPDLADRARAGGARPPAYALVVPALAGLGGLGFLVWRPGVARSMVGSPRALAFTVIISAALLGATWLLPRMGVRPVGVVVAQIVPTGLAFALAVLPAFHQVTVVEAFPGADPVAGPTAVGSDRAATPERADVIARAPLHGIDHDARGAALLIMRSDGSQVVRLQSLDVEPGPDYQLHLVPGGGQTRPDGGVHLGKLRGNRGDQNYVVPERAEVGGTATVLIWCRAFAVPVAAATLR